MKTQLYLEKDLMQRTIRRMAHTLYEQHGDFSNVIFVGILKKGYQLALLLEAIIFEISDLHVPTFPLEIRPFRDDEKQNTKVAASSFETKGKNIILIDDVLFTGRSIRAALTALQSFGRPDKIELLTLIDRRFSRHLPIQPEYRGRQVDVINHEKVKVMSAETDAPDAI
jgi:pyrimidine operon attenuation protein/uracil phosphoribosyltransferase